MGMKLSCDSASVVYILLYSLSLCPVVLSSSRLDVTQENVHLSSSPFQRVVHALQKLDEECKPQESWQPLSTYTVTLSCTVEGDVMTSEMVITLVVGQRTIWVFEMQKISCRYPVSVFDVTDCMKSKWIDTAPGISITLLKAITASSRYSNIIYGVGSSLGRFLPILRFDLAADFSVSEYLLRRTNFSVADIQVRICGFTSGTCQKETNCLLYCYCMVHERFKKDGRLCKAFFFREPVQSNMGSYISYQKLGLKNVIKKGILQSISLDKAGRVYTIYRNPITHSSKLLISSLITKRGHRVFILKILNEFHIKPDSVVYIDVNRNGIISFSDKQSVLIAETKKDLLNAEFKSLEINTKRKIEIDRGTLVCWLHGGNGLALIANKTPFKRKTVHL